MSDHSSLEQALAEALRLYQSQTWWMSDEAGPTMFARYLLQHGREPMDSWLAAHDEDVRQAERERLQADAAAALDADGLVITTRAERALADELAEALRHAHAIVHPDDRCTLCAAYRRWAEHMTRSPTPRQRHQWGAAIKEEARGE